MIEQNFSNPKKILIAVAKGRILNEAYQLLEEVGIVVSEQEASSRRLKLNTNFSNIDILVVRATDVPTYVDYGAADIGITGKDILLESSADGYYEPLDLKISKCRLSAAGLKTERPNLSLLRVATKYPKVAREYYQKIGIQAEIITLYGSMELAPIVGLADEIVDLVDTGKTLRANNLKVIEDIRHISSRLIINKASFKVKSKEIKCIIKGLENLVEHKNE
ncbi:MAG: ATP phosphoribosyltransferase [Pseudomonadota bacterium]|nr:ATP phosphoribosyltransferase [Pseudomonadota bacterium]